jgi:hypothetical protein
MYPAGDAFKVLARLLVTTPDNCVEPANFGVLK